MDTKSQVDVKAFAGFAIIMVGVLAVTLLGMGFIFSNPAMVWVGSLVLGILSVMSAIMEKVLLP
ncbi:MAG: hypothetical protein AABX13_03280 [Nanoarchaeota archaeon]